MIPAAYSQVKIVMEEMSDVLLFYCTYIVSSASVTKKGMRALSDMPPSVSGQNSQPGCRRNSIQLYHDLTTPRQVELMHEI